MGYTSIAVDPSGLSLKVTVGSNTPEYIPFSDIKGVRGHYLDFRRIGETTQTVGSGLDDLTPGGAPTVGTSATYEIVIVSAATPDTFKWRKKVGNVWTDYSTAANVTGSAIALENGITITFGATTGHDADDAWEFTVQEQSAVSDGETYAYDQAFRVYVNLDEGRTFDFDIQQVTGRATWVATQAGLAIAVADIESWIP